VKSIVRQCLRLLAFLVFAVSYAYGDDVSYRSATLTICNKGSEQVNVAVAIRDSLWPVPPFNSWEVSGWKSIVPGHCERVYRETGEPAYIGFAFFDSQNHFTGAGHIGQAPDFGWNGFTRVLTRSDKRLCVQGSQGMAYKIRNDPTPAVDCASFHSGGNDPGGYVPLASALYFVPKVTECRSGVGIFSGQVSCTGGDYYLNVKPTASDRELHASAGSESGKDQSPAEPSIGDAILKELGKAAAEQRKRREEMQAEEAVQEKARAETSVKQNVCISDDLTTEWRNPPAGGKMESLQRLLIQSLRERAKTSGYDQTRWIAVDSRYYSAWPNTSWGKLVSTIPGGSCGAAGHREILALAP
jgi:uncharacterized protein DUF1036